MSDKEDVSRRPALTNPMATNLRTTGERHQFCSLQGQGALVTGASGGIGLAIVERLAECGVNVCIVARRVEKLNELKEKLETEYPDVTIFPLQLDVSKASEEEMLKIPEKVPFQVDILVNNAGLALGTEAVDTNSISDAMTVVNTNIMGVVGVYESVRERDERKRQRTYCEHFEHCRTRGVYWWEHLLRDKARGGCVYAIGETRFEKFESESVERESGRGED